MVTNRLGGTPLTLDDATRALYNHAITNPSSLTDAKRRTIAYRPSPEEDELCRAACGLSVTGLVAKAIKDRDSLTYTEADLLTNGLNHQAEKLLHEQTRLSAADRDLTYRVIDAVKAQYMKTAQANAYHLRRQWNAISPAAFHSVNGDDRRNILYVLRVPRQEHILGLNTLLCGQLVFRVADVDNNAEWAPYE